PAGKKRRDGKYQCRDRKRCFAAIAVAEAAGNQRAKETPNQSGAVGPRNRLRTVQMEICLIEGFGAPYDHPVITEQKATKGGNERDNPDISQADVGFRRFGGLCNRNDLHGLAPDGVSFLRYAGLRLRQARNTGIEGEETAGKRL